MPLKIPKLFISLSLGLFAWQTAFAQLAPADDFFDSGAQFYISNNIPAALERVETGLRDYPNNEKLKKLEQLLKQKQKQQQQQQKQQQKKNQKSRQQKSKNQKNQQQKNQQSSRQKSQQQKHKKKQQKQNEAKKKKEEQQKKQSSAEKKKAEEQKKHRQKKQPLKPGQMTPQEAKRLLDSQKGDEQMLQLKPKKKSNVAGPIKDW